MLSVVLDGCVWSGHEHLLAKHAGEQQEGTGKSSGGEKKDRAPKEKWSSNISSFPIPVSLFYFFSFSFSSLYILSHSY